MSDGPKRTEHPFRAAATIPAAPDASTRADEALPDDVAEIYREAFAQMLEVAAANSVDPVERYVRELPDEPPWYWRRYARETVRLRAELLSHMQRAFSAAMMPAMQSGDTQRRIVEAVAHADYVAKHAVDTVARWAQLVQCAQRWWSLQAPDAFIMRVRP